MMMMAIGSRKKTSAEDVDPGLRAAGEAAGDHVDAHVFIVQQGVAGERQEDQPNRYHWISSKAFEL